MAEQIIANGILFLVGLLLVVLGYLIWKKEKISLIHSYHYTKVKDEDKKAYTDLMGKALVIMGVGIILTGVINFITMSAFGWWCYGVFFVTGIIMIIFAQKKYNGGLF